MHAVVEVRGHDALHAVGEVEERPLDARADAERHRVRPQEAELVQAVEAEAPLPIFAVERAALFPVGGHPEEEVLPERIAVVGVVEPVNLAELHDRLRLAKKWFHMPSSTISTSCVLPTMLCSSLLAVSKCHSPLMTSMSFRRPR